MAGAVCGSTGALRGTLAVMRGHAAEGALIDLAVLPPRERQAPMFQLVDRLRRAATHIFDRILIAEPVGTLDGVVHVPAPVILAHIAERSGDAALRRNGVGAGREYLGDAGGLEPRLAAAHHRAQARSAGADHDHVVAMIFDRIDAAVEGRALAIRSAVASHASQLEA